MVTSKNTIIYDYLYMDRSSYFEVLSTIFYELFFIIEQTVNFVVFIKVNSNYS